MKVNASHFLIFLSIVMCLKSHAQEKTMVVKAWAIEETIMGGAPPPKNERPPNRTTRRFFLETKPGAQVKVNAVWIGKTIFSVYEETYNIKAPDRDYRPTDLATTNNNFTQFLATDTLKARCGGKAPIQIQGNEAVIVFSINGKKYYAPITAIEHTQINLP